MFGLYLHISGLFFIHITFWLVNWMVYAAEFKLIIHFDASYTWVTRWCLYCVTDIIANSRWFEGCTLPISVLTSFTHFHYFLILNIFTILSWILDMLIPVSLASFEINKVWVDLLQTGSSSSFIFLYISEMAGYVTFDVSQLFSSIMKNQGNCHISSSDGQKFRYNHPPLEYEVEKTHYCHKIPIPL